MNEKQWWPSGSLRELEAHIYPQADICDYSYPPGRRPRYTAAGWEKIVSSGMAILDVRDFGASSETVTGNK